MRKLIWLTAAVLPAVIVFFGASVFADVAGTDGKPEQPAPSLTGEVLHTPQWNANRLAANQFYETRGFFEKKREISVFWSGEKFVLRASAEGEPQPSYVRVRIEGTDYETVLHRKGSGYEGVLFEKTMRFRWGLPEPETLVFLFEAEAGKTHLMDRQTVTVDDRAPYWMLHRKESEFWIEERES